MITIRDFATQEGISYEAARKQIARYAEDLKGHIIRDNRQRLLDDFAVDFLREHRRKNPVVIQQYDTTAELQQLKYEKEQLLLQLNSVQAQLVQAQQQLLDQTGQMAELQARLTAAEQPRRRWWPWQKKGD